MSQWDYQIDQPMPGPFPFPNSRKDPGIEVGCCKAMSKSSCVTSILTCKENFIINLFKNIVCCSITFLYYKRNRKTRFLRLWCDNTLGKC